MGRTVQGQVDDHLAVTDALTIQGSVANGAAVHRGGRLLMQGAFSGDLTVESGGTATVQGVFQGRVLNRGGTVRLSGVVSLELVVNEGSTAVAAGSLVDGRVLTSSGETRPARDGESLNIGTQYVEVR